MVPIPSRVSGFGVMWIHFTDRSAFPSKDQLNLVVADVEEFAGNVIATDDMTLLGVSVFDQTAFTGRRSQGV
jgi:hypothetical protein